MNKTAYDECYLNSMILKVRYLFKLLARNKTDVFQTIQDYMMSEYRKKMDMGNPLYLNKTPKQIMSSIGIQGNMDLDISEDYDEFILEWMADVYTYMQWKYNIPSKEIVSRIKPEELYRKFSPLHEMSLENSVDKLMEIYQLQGMSDHTT